MYLATFDIDTQEPPPACAATHVFVLRGLYFRDMSIGKAAVVLHYVYDSYVSIVRNVPAEAAESNSLLTLADQLQFMQQRHLLSIKRPIGYICTGIDHSGDS